MTSNANMTSNTCGHPRQGGKNEITVYGNNVNIYCNRNEEPTPSLNNTLTPSISSSTDIEHNHTPDTGCHSAVAKPLKNVAGQSTSDITSMLKDHRRLIFDLRTELMNIEELNKLTNQHFKSELNKIRISLPPAEKKKEAPVGCFPRKQVN